MLHVDSVPTAKHTPHIGGSFTNLTTFIWLPLATTGWERLPDFDVLPILQQYLYILETLTTTVLFA